MRTILVMFFGVNLALAGELAGSRPNIIVILTDDQGYGDLSCHGNPVLKTPNLDKMHAQSVRFNDFHVSPTCAPTRSALLTGRHEFKNGITHTILERERLAPKAITLAETLQKSGYTTGMFGKWHLGDEPAYQPNRRGFDHTFIHGAGGIGQTYPGSCGDAPGNKYFDPVILNDGKFEKTKGYCTDVFFAEATKWIDASAGKKPFFCWLATNAPHAPLQVRPEDEARYAKSGVDAKTAKFFGMIANIDDNVGKLLAHLDDTNLSKNTLVIFLNDNGGTGGITTFNAGMRGAKNTPWLGGTRAAFFWRWPGTLEPKTLPQLTAHIDLTPTLTALAGVKPEGALAEQIEGRNLIPLLNDAKAAWPDRTLFTHVGRWAKGSDVNAAKHAGCSVRRTDWQMVNLGKGWQLFHLPDDPGEKTDVMAKHPDIAKAMEADYDRWWASLPPYLVNETAVGPKVNPFHELYWKQFDGPGPNNVPRPK